MSQGDSIFILVLESKNISGERWYRSTANAYSKVLLDGKKCFKTPIVDKSNDPKWEEKAHHLQLEGRKTGDLKIQMWDYTVIGFNKMVGEVDFKIADLIDGVPRDDWFNLKLKKKDAGQVHLQLLYLEPGDTITSDYSEFPHPLQTLLRKKKIEQFKHGVEVKDLENQDTHGGNRPLHVAASLNLPDCVNLLVQKGASIEGTNGDGARPLHCAAQHSAGSVQILLAKGADKMAKDNKGGTPLHYAARGNNAQAVALLIAAGADINAQDNNGETPLAAALQSKESFDAIRALLAHKPDVFKADKNGWACDRLCLDETRVTMRTRIEFFKAADVIDEREFALQRDFPSRQFVEGKIGGGWQKSPQYSLSCANNQNPTNAVRIIMHFDDDDGGQTDKMAKTGFLVFGSSQDVHKEPSYYTSSEGYGSIEPTVLLFRRDPPPADEAQAGGKKPDWRPFHTIVPYGKTDHVRGRFKLVIYAQEPLIIKELVDWKHKVTAIGEWNANTAGGCKQYQDTWTNNPKFTLELPAGKKGFPLCVMLSQAKSPMDLVAFQVMPYQFFIGYYVLADMDIMFETSKWLNSLDVWDTLALDTTQQNKFVVMPTTFKQGQLTTFTVTVLSDEEVKLN